MPSEQVWFSPSYLKVPYFYFHHKIYYVIYSQKGHTCAGDVHEESNFKRTYDCHNKKFKRGKHHKL